MVVWHEGGGNDGIIGWGGVHRGLARDCHG